jgi:hypothetical protein
MRTVDDFAIIDLRELEIQFDGIRFEERKKHAQATGEFRDELTSFVNLFLDCLPDRKPRRYFLPGILISLSRRAHRVVLVSHRGFRARLTWRV